MFKNKDKKKKQEHGRITATVDSKHQEKVNFFDEKKKVLPKLKSKLVVYHKELNQLEKKANFALSEIEKRSELRQSIDELEKEIDNIENNVDEMNYYHSTAHNYLIPYYEVVIIINNNI